MAATHDRSFRCFYGRALRHVAVCGESWLARVGGCRAGNGSPTMPGCGCSHRRAAPLLPRHDGARCRERWYRRAPGRISLRKSPLACRRQRRYNAGNRRVVRIDHEHTPPPPPPPCLKAFAIVLLSAALALPAPAQAQTRVMNAGPATVYSLTTPLVGPAVRVGSKTWTALTRDLEIEARPNPQGMMNFGVGSDVRCAYGPGDRDQTQVVEFHNPTGRYSRGQPIARACPHWGPRKCSRTVTVNLGALGMHTYTVNRGYPRCPGAWDTTKMVEVDGESVSTRVGAPALGPAADDIPDNRQEITATDRQQGTHNGIFTVRIWGKICLATHISNSPDRCVSLKDNDPVLLGSNFLNAVGYVATFPSRSHCGPPRWPTPELQAMGRPPYAEWCDVTVDVRR